MQTTQLQERLFTLPVISGSWSAFLCKFKNPAFPEDCPEASHTCRDTEEHGRTLDTCWRTHCQYDNIFNYYENIWPQTFEW